MSQKIPFVKNAKEDPSHYFVSVDLLIHERPKRQVACTDYPTPKFNFCKNNGF